MYHGWLRQSIGTITYLDYVKTHSGNTYSYGWLGAPVHPTFTPLKQPIDLTIDQLIVNKMKTTKTIKNSLMMMLLLAGALAATSCKKSDAGGGGDAAPGTIKAKINGASFTSLSMTSAASRVSVAGTTMVTIQGSESSGKAIMFVINGVSGTGTYQIGGGANISISASYTEVNISNPTATKVWQAPFDSSVAGEISIAEFTDKVVKGTFNFSARSSQDQSMREVTEGSFNMTF